AGVADAVFVRILPHEELAKPRILRIEDAVVVAVVGAEALEVGVGANEVSHERDFRAAVDRPVAVAVERQEGLPARDPADRILLAVAVDVELRRVEGLANTRAVKVEHDRREFLYILADKRIALPVVAHRADRRHSGPRLIKNGVAGVVGAIVVVIDDNGLP